MRLVFMIILALAVIATAGTTMLAIVVSRANYPGAAALDTLHRTIDLDRRSPDEVLLMVSFEDGDGRVETQHEAVFSLVGLLRPVLFTRSSRFNGLY